MTRSYKNKTIFASIDVDILNAFEMDKLHILTFLDGKISNLTLRILYFFINIR